ncbi:MAG: hypothetical protein KGI38_05410 [Thaumarchaeota archaeon]|nr:hypothetical protein [Nitrososphaerota archaeon]
MTLSAESTERIDLLFRIAERNGSLISVQELPKFMPDGETASEIAEAIANDPALRVRFELEGGYLTPRTEGRGSETLEKEQAGRARARINLSHAARFASFLSPGGFEMVAVSGSTSYGSASRSKDLDLFCVAPSGKMWAPLTQSLLMARIYKLLSRGSPQICISCVMDLAYATAQFSRPQGPLFARDALQTKVLKGNETYRTLMAAADWISEFYPHAYRRDDLRPAHNGPRTGPSAFDRAVDRLLSSIVGRYLMFKASALNAKLRMSADVDDIFEMHLGEDHLVYESRRYTNLRSKYDDALQQRGAF